MNAVLLQFDTVWEDKPANHARIERMLQGADVAPGSLVVLPELGDTGFSFNLDRIVDQQTLRWGAHIARQYRIWLQVGYAVRAEDGRGRNCASIIDPEGHLVATYHKIHPFSFGKEIDYYDGGQDLAIVDVKLMDPASENDACTVAVAPLICYDLRFPELWRLASRAGAEVFTIGASWPAERQHHWRSLVVARAIENQAFVIAVNRTGDDPKIHYAGGSMIVSPLGEILAEAGDQPTVLQAELDVLSLRTWRETFPALRDSQARLLGAINISRHPVP